MKKETISINNVSFSYNGIEAIHNITLDIKKGELISIIGPNGGGKTTLLNVILGFLKAEKGEIKIFGEDIKKVYSAISYVPQIAEVDRNFPISVIETVMTAFLKSGLHPFKVFKTEERKAALKLLKRVGLEEKAKRQIGELSGGEFQRLMIARALAANPQILLLDEPTANVDPVSKEKIFALLKELKNSGLTVITVTHDIAFATEISSKLACINRELIYFGEPVINDLVKNTMYGMEDIK